MILKGTGIVKLSGKPGGAQEPLLPRQVSDRSLN